MRVRRLKQDEIKAVFNGSDVKEILQGEIGLLTKEKQTIE